MVKAVSAVTEYLGNMVKFVTDLLMNIAAAILKAAIGCDPITPARNMLAATANVVKDKLVEWVQGYVLPTLKESDLERDKDFERHMDEVKVYENEKGACLKEFSTEALDAISKAKDECIKGKVCSDGAFKSAFARQLCRKDEEKAAAGGLERLTLELERSTVEMERSAQDKEYEKWFKATAGCRTASNIAFRTPI